MDVSPDEEVQGTNTSNVGSKKQERHQKKLPNTSVTDLSAVTKWMYFVSSRH